MINEREEIELTISITFNKEGFLADIGVFTKEHLLEQIEFINDIFPKKLGYRTDFTTIRTDISFDLEEYIRRKGYVKTN